MTLLRLLRTKDKYDKLRRAVPDSVLDIKTKTILDDFGKYFREFDVERIEEEPFWLWFRTFAHPKLNDEQRAIYQGVLKQVQEDLDPSLEAGLMSRLVSAATAADLLSMIERFHEGDEIDFGSELRSRVERFELEVNRKVKTPWVQDDINLLLQEDANDTGFHWRLEEVNLAMRPLRGGDFGIIAARPDVGKTTFTADNLTHFAAQVDQLFPGEGREILWFNNEGPGNRIVKRNFQSALNATTSELVAMSQAGTIGKRYVEATGGRPHTIRVFDIHDFWNYEVEDIIRQHKPALILFDMIDNIKFGGSVSNNGQRTDQLLEAMYQWGRIQAVKNDCPVLATSQISADGENQCYPTLSMLKDSKTGKQGAADFIMTIGYNSDFTSSRYLGLTKNKLARENGPKQLKAEVIFDGQRGRYVTPSQFNGAQ